MSLLALALRNVMRNRFRATLTVLGVAMAVVAFVMLRTVLSAWNVAVEHAAQDRIATRHKVSFVIQLPRRYIDTVRAVPGVQKATWANWFGAKDPNHPDDFFASMAVDPRSFLEVYDEVVTSDAERARWFEDRAGALVGDVLAKKLGLEPGDKITLQGTIYPGDWTFTVSGIYRAARRSVDRSMFLFHWDYLNDTVPERRRDQIGWIVARIADPGAGAEISKRIDRIFEEHDAQTLTMSERAMNLSFMGMMSAILTAVNIVSVIILAIMTMILGNTIAMGVRERTHEYGVLRAIGFLPRHLGWFVVGESIGIGLLGGLLGLALSYPFVQQGLGAWLEENMGGFFPYFRIAPADAAIALGLSAVLGVLAAALPASQAMRLRVTDALRRIG